MKSCQSSMVLQWKSSKKNNTCMNEGDTKNKRRGIKNE